jgi:hypothetical protein
MTYIRRPEPARTSSLEGLSWTSSLSKESLKLGDELVPEYLGPADWTGTLFQKCLDDMDMISEHYYNYDSHFDLASAKEVPNAPNEPLVDWIRRPGQPHPPEVRGVPGVPRAHPRAEAEARAHRARRVRLHVRRQLQGGGAVLSGKGTLRRMAPQSLTANVVVGQEPGVRIDVQWLTALPANPTFAPHSVNLYEFPVK